MKLEPRRTWEFHAIRELAAAAAFAAAACAQAVERIDLGGFAEPSPFHQHIQ